MISPNYSPVNQLLRNPLRVLNHLDLINKKIKIAKKWSLIIDPTNQYNDEIKNILDRLKDNKIQTKDALFLIKEVHGNKYNDLEYDLLECYTTGQVEFHITDLCDLKCKECHYSNKKTATIPFSEIANILMNLSPKAVTVTGGGEPNVYRSEGKGFNEVILEIRRIFPNIAIGLINNNTALPEGDWTRHIQWQRTSLDASSPETYYLLKQRDKYQKVVDNIMKLIYETTIPYIGIGFLYRNENVHEIYSFLLNWYNWFKNQSLEIKGRFNIQFRPLSPPIEDVESVRENRVQPNNIVLLTLIDQIQKVENKCKNEKEFEYFLNFSTNFNRLKDQAENPFIHSPNNFYNCYNALIHRVYRATGDEYPDFLLCNYDSLSLGNLLNMDVHSRDYEKIKIVLMQFYYFNRLGYYCESKHCRQGWVSKLCEDYYQGDIPPEQLKEIPVNYFF